MTRVQPMWTFKLFAALMIIQTLILMLNVEIFAFDPKRENELLGRLAVCVKLIAFATAACLFLNAPHNNSLISKSNAWRSLPFTRLSGGCLTICLER